MRAPLASLPLLASLLALAAPVWAGDPEDQLGPAFQEAEPAQRVVLLAEAGADKVLTHAQVTAAVERVVRAALREAEGPKARLERLGGLRAGARERLQALNAARKEAGKPPVPGHSIEPDQTTQEAVAVEYVVATAFGAGGGGLDGLACLADVRAHVLMPLAQRLTMYYVEQAVRRDEAWAAADEAGRKARLEGLPDQVLPYAIRQNLARVLLATESLCGDPGYRKADLKGRLTRIKAVPQQELPQRQAVVDALLCDWLSAELAAGKAPAALKKQLEKLRKEGLITTPPYAERLLERIGELR